MSDYRKNAEIKFGEKPPKGWMVVGQFSKNVEQNNRSSGICLYVMRTNSWVVARIPDLVATHPEWSAKPYLDKVGRLSDHYPPDLIEELKKISESETKPPEGWMVVGGYKKDKKKDIELENGIAGYVKKSAHWVVARIPDLVATHPEWSAKPYLDGNDNLNSHYPPDLIAELKKLSDAEKRPPEGWMVVGDYVQEKESNKTGLAGYIGRSKQWASDRIPDLVATHPEWSAKPYLDEGGRLFDHYPPDLIAELKKLSDAEKRPPEGWMVVGGYSKDKKTGEVNRNSGIAGQIRRSKQWASDRIPDLVATHPEWSAKPYLDEGGRMEDHYPPELIAELKKLSDAEKRPPEGWMVVGGYSKDKKTGQIRKSTGIAGCIGRSPGWLKPRILKLVELNIEWAAKLYLDEINKMEDHYPPELIAELKKMSESETKPPEGWMVIGNYGKDKKTGEVNRDSGIAGHIMRSPRWVNDHIPIILSNHPDWSSKPYLSSANDLRDHYPPALVVELKKLSDAEKNNKESNAVEIENEEKSKEEAKKVIQEISEGKTEAAQHIRKLIEFFGGSSALNILYKFHPEFKSLPVEYVKSCLADYLGDFLSAKNNFNLDNINLAVEMLSDPDCQDCAYKAIKNHCLKYYYEQRRSGVFQDGLSIIHAYLDHVLAKMEGVSNKFLDDIIQKVLEFYNSALRDFKKPEQFVDRLSEGRDFPDINQRVNMKELADNKRMLIADEMGLGKSASVIMAKEQLGIPCALIVAPSNVIDTWAGYLSDDEKKGYFKKGEAPRVLIIENPKQLVGISKADYDYILISQERMVPSYTKPLEEMDIDMMVVDEVHKIKNVHGVRTQSFLPLAKKMEGDNKYLALLSGTPAPNKVKDVAIILKLLYPEEFAEIEDTDLVRSIIRGDIANLSSLLMLRMQMKNLEDSVEMPELTQEVVSIEMSSLEKDIYEVLLEEDEFTAQEKLHILRQFLLNPHLLDSTPGLESCKIKALEQELQHAFETKSKVVLFANIDIENIIRGDNSILGRLNLPPDVEVRVIEGDPKNKKYRKGIQDEFNEDNGKKILLVVSGKTADVGVNFTGGEEVIFYNEPWTEADRRQQLARVYRPGQEKPIVVKTLIVKNTIEEGIHSYIQAKHKAIEKLLRGVPLNDLEKAQLAKDEKSEDKSAEINREWAEYFFSSVEMMNKMFGAVKNIGEERFRKFLEEYGARYAEAYRDLGSRSYQSNSNRVTGTLIANMVEKSGTNPNELAILDVASGPEMLRRHIVDNLRDSVHSLDINPEHFDKNPGNKYVGSWTKMPFEDKSFDYLNLAMSLHYSEFAPSKGKFERVELLKEMNRVLKEGGRVVISMIYSLQLKDMEKFEKFVEALGFKIVGDYSGIAESDVNFRSQVLTLEKVKDVDKTAQQIVSEVGEENSAGLKFDKVKIKLKNQRRVLRSFFLDGKGKTVEHNSGDRKIMEEEAQITAQGTHMKEKHGSIKGIPAEEIIETNFVRILPKKRYMLFKRLVSGPGAVVIKDSDKIEDVQK